MSDLLLSGPGNEMRTVTLGAVKRVRDVLVWQTNHGAGTTEDFHAHPPIDAPIFGREGDERAGPVDLGRGLMIGRLERDLADRVMEACTPAGVNFSPHRQFGERYSFIREVDTAEWDDSPYAWDREHVIWDALLLSRLVRDNSCSTTYAARVVDFDNDERVIVYTLFPEAKTVYRVRRDRDWLDPAEGRELASLLAMYWEAEAQGLPGRVNRAWGRTESASWQRTGDAILPVLVSGLESLLKTERHPATQQFVTRCQALAGELAIDGVSEVFLREMYDGRSDWVHGATVRLFESDRPGQEGLMRPTTDNQWEVFDRIALLQQVLRSVVRRCFEDDEFRAVFSDDDLIRQRWPL